MRNQIRQAMLCCALLLAGMHFARAQQPGHDETQVVFRFVSGNDMFYIPWNDNGARLDSLCERLNPAKFETGSVRVDGYGPNKKIVKIRCNRVKSALILRRGLTESHFTTTNRIGSFNGLSDVVVVTCPFFEQRETDTSTTDREAERHSEQQQTVTEKTQEPTQETTTTSDGQQTVIHEITKEAQVQTGETPKLVPSRCYAGLNVGIPFFWGDMLPTAADKTHVGFAVGVQGGYHISDLLAVSLSVDYARGKLGTRDNAEDHLLAPDGMTWYVPQEQTMQRYGDLYSKVSLVNVGLSLDVNINRIFGKQVVGHRFTVWVSPTVYGQFFSADIYTKADDKRYSDGTTKPDGLSLGLGGALSLHYRINRSIDLQLKNSVLWMTDNHFDGIRTPFGKTKHNALWMPQVGILWNIK